MNVTTVRLLRAASETVGGTKPLAELLGISESLLSYFLAGTIELPDQLLLRTADIILAERQLRFSAAGVSGDA